MLVPTVLQNPLNTFHCLGLTTTHTHPYSQSWCFHHHHFFLLLAVNVFVCFSADQHRLTKMDASRIWNMLPALTLYDVAMLTLSESQLRTGQHQKLLLPSLGCVPLHFLACGVMYTPTNAVQCKSCGSVTQKLLFNCTISFVFLKMEMDWNVQSI